MAVTVEDITYAGDVSAWLVRPEEAPPSSIAGIVLWHWFSQEPLGDRNEFIDEARELAERGTACLLPQGRFPWFDDPTGAVHDVAALEGEVARFSAGLDLLVARTDVDGGRLAIVGHDFGAMLASIVAAREARVRTCVLIAPTPRWADWFLPFWAIEEERSAYLRTLEPLDPQAQMASIAPRPVLLQLAECDYFVPLMAGFELRRASGGSHALDVRQYDADHEMRSDDARRDRAAFLADVLSPG
jgi:pimeloyl-ACP methyl ester carboxylesterase